MLQTSRGDWAAPIETTGNIRGDVLLPLETTGSTVRSDATVPVEAIGNIRRDLLLPLEVTGSALRSDAVLPMETTGGIRYDTLVPAESIAANRLDLAVPTEMIGSIRSDISVAIEWLIVARRDHITPAEVLAVSRSDALAPVEIISGVKIAEWDNIVPLEIIGAARRDLVVQTEATGNIGGVMGGASLNPFAAPFDPSFGISGGGSSPSSMPMEILIVARRDLIQPTEALAVVRRDTLEPTEILSSVRAISWDNIVPLEITGNVRRDLIVPSERTGNFRSDVLAPVEWLGAIRADLPVAVEWLGAIAFVVVRAYTPSPGAKAVTLLRQNTPTLINVGPIVGSDFLTVQTGVTLSVTHAELFQAGSTAAIDISGRTWAHISGGVYQLTLTPGDLSVLGPLLVNIHATATAPFSVHADVLSQAAYDALCGGGGMPSNMMAIFGNSTSAANLSQSALGIVTVTLQAGGTTTILPTNLTSAISQFYVGRTLVFVSGPLAGEASLITGYNGATKQLTVNALTSAPGTGDTAIII
jgi:hypothetical protein